MKTYVLLNEDSPPVGLREFRQWLADLEEKCPPEFRDQIYVQDGYYAEGMCVGYDREETAEEEAARVKRETDYREWRRRQGPIDSQSSLGGFYSSSLIIDSIPLTSERN